MIVKIARVLIALTALGSFLVAAFLCFMGAALSMADNFNGPHTRTISGIVLLELCVLLVLWGGYRWLK